MGNPDWNPSLRIFPKEHLWRVRFFVPIFLLGTARSVVGREAARCLAVPVRRFENSSIGGDPDRKPPIWVSVDLAAVPWG
jgi:hypothetical protein